LIRIVGPQTAHKYHPDSKVELARMLDAIAERGRDPYPRKIRFTTWTLAYNWMKWVTIDGLAEHWLRARLNAEVVGDSGVNLETVNVTAFTLEMGPGGCPLDLGRKAAVSIDGQKLSVPGPMSDRSWTVHFRKTRGQWSVAEGAIAVGLHKVHGLQGPIDDAFLDRFVFVSPTGTPSAPAVAPWVTSEEKRAIAEWRRQFRGDAMVRDDKDVTDADIAASNLILWGDPGSNRVLGRIADKLPVRWPGASQALIMVYPNPLNPKKYVVLNSGFTFREADYASNAMQTPKLPDFAIVDTATPAGSKWPGKIVQAGFFNEDWKR
jgi:hypothetical protein